MLQAIRDMKCAFFHVYTLFYAQGIKSINSLRPSDAYMRQ